MGSDLAVRSVSAAILIVIAGTGIALGGNAFLLLVLLVGGGVLWEWRGLVRRFATSGLERAGWMTAGMIYLILACLAVLLLNTHGLFLPLLAAVIGTDVGAYCAGRTIGGRRIAPAISPSKTWAGLFGGMAGAAFALMLVAMLSAGLVARLDGTGTGRTAVPSAAPLILGGFAIAIVAQAGDFFESWMKRRAGVKDSGTLIPGHGGLFDRVDGLLAASLLGAGLFLSRWGSVA
jgi:phosphatidate cytidylyltransferase